MLNYSWLVLLLLHFAFPQTTDKYSDENRPYKFGFNIQGYQHRQEEKDEKGLIKGEYGFITADGYYRVTVYATDENGDFRIISMKNYYVGFPPEDPTTTPGSPTDRSATPRQFQPNPSLARAPGATGRALGTKGELARTDESTPKTPKSFTRPQGIAACSDCSIPTTTPKTNRANLLMNPGNFRSGRTRVDSFGLTFGQGPDGLSPQIPQSPRGKVQITENKTPQFPQKATAQGPADGQAPQFPQGAPRSNIQFPGVTRNDFSTGPVNAFDNRNRQVPSDRAGLKPQENTFGLPDPGLARGRTDFTQDNQLDGTPKRRPQIGEVREGLPPGVTLNDIKDLLYTFNYTVGFHGHHEDGYRNGDKQGDYFFDSRDGIERKVEYLANEFGYQPNITLIDLPENDVRRPNEQTEKDYGLKGYEFKWFYRK